jgi:hypothetical protein
VIIHGARPPVAGARPCMFLALAVVDSWCACARRAGGAGGPPSSTCRSVRIHSWSRLATRLSRRVFVTSEVP